MTNYPDGNNPPTQFTPHTISQTGSDTPPIQVENVQYNVSVPRYESKIGIAFTIASAGFAVALFSLAFVLHSITSILLDFAPEDVAVLIQVFAAAMIPAAIIGVLAVKRLETIIAENPAALEDIKFKARLRRNLWGFLVISGFLVFNFLFNLFGLFAGDTEGLLEVISFSVYFGGGAILFTLWLYRYQLKTSR